MKAKTNISFENNTKVRIAYVKPKQEYHCSIFFEGSVLEKRACKTRADAEAEVVNILDDLGVADQEIMEQVRLILEYDGNAKIVKGNDRPSTTISFFLY